MHCARAERVMEATCSRVVGWDKLASRTLLCEPTHSRAPAHQRACHPGGPALAIETNLNGESIARACPTLHHLAYPVFANRLYSRRWLSAWATASFVPSGEMSRSRPEPGSLKM